MRKRKRIEDQIEEECCLGEDEMSNMINRKEDEDQ